MSFTKLVNSLKRPLDTLGEEMDVKLPKETVKTKREPKSPKEPKVKKEPKIKRDPGQPDIR